MHGRRRPRGRSPSHEGGGRDGFFLKLVHLDYRSPLPGAPKTKALSAELHVEFSLPGQVKDGVQSAPVFPLARVAPAGADARRDVVGRAARRTQRALALPP